MTSRMGTTQTARNAAKHGVKQGMMVFSLYTERWLPIIAARECGCHVMLTTEQGKELLVDASERMQCRTNPA